jgi:hypothetical protein
VCHEDTIAKTGDAIENRTDLIPCQAVLIPDPKDHFAEGKDAFEVLRESISFRTDSV